jgi:rhodanese-related sulfurtransferase
MASHQAARRAVKAGFTKVYVMPAGIDGWNQAGKKTESGGAAAKS